MEQTYTLRFRCALPGSSSKHWGQDVSGAQDMSYVFILLKNL